MERLDIKDLLSKDKNELVFEIIKLKLLVDYEKEKSFRKGKEHERDIREIEFGYMTGMGG